MARLSLTILALGTSACSGGTPVDPPRDAATRDSATADGGTDAGEQEDTGPLPDVGPLPDSGPIDSGVVTPAWCPTATDEGPPPTCPAVSARTETVIAAGEITSSTTWDCEHNYRLTGIVFVTAGTLTIEAGTEVRGDIGSALVVTRNATIEAAGHPSAPIVFTSSAAEGTRDRGAWGGLVLLGDAPINIAGGENRIEGLTGTDPRGAYGGTDAAHDCGTLRYARIEYAGFEFSVDNELNGLTLGGCGSATSIDHVQVHLGSDDGIEVFGGTPDLSYIVISGASDDSLDWDLGWIGRVQYLIVQQHVDTADCGFEGDNLRDNEDATPRSHPTIFNATLLGARDDVSGTQPGMRLRRGTHATLRNFIVQGFSFGTASVDGVASQAAVTAGTLVLSNSLFFDVGPDGATPFAAGTLPATLWTAPTSMNRTADPMLAAPYDIVTPDFTPLASSTVDEMAATPPADGFFDPQAEYLGAIGPGCADWTVGWTAYPSAP